MAEARENSNPYPKDDEENPDKKENPESQTEDEKKKEPIDLTIVLCDAEGQAAALPLSAYSYLSRQLEPKLMKADFMTDFAKSDLVFQVFFYPLSTFKEQNTLLDIGHIQEIRFVFDRTEEGVVVIDNIGFWKDQANAAF